jgi:hypothetical protein
MEILQGKKAKWADPRCFLSFESAKKKMTLAISLCALIFTGSEIALGRNRRALVVETRDDCRWLLVKGRLENVGRDPESVEALRLLHLIPRRS